MIKSDEIGWPFCIFVQFKKLAGFGILIVGLFFILFFCDDMFLWEVVFCEVFFVHVSSNLLMKFWHFHQCMTLHNKRSLLVPLSSFLCFCVVFIFALFESLLLLLSVWSFFFFHILYFYIDGYGRQLYSWHTIFRFVHIVVVNNVFSNTFTCLHHCRIHSNLRVLSNSLVIWRSRD